MKDVFIFEGQAFFSVSSFLAMQARSVKSPTRNVDKHDHRRALAGKIGSTAETLATTALGFASFPDS
jgi:hypothetical protein